jgi:hypothetical protein
MLADTETESVVEPGVVYEEFVSSATAGYENKGKADNEDTVREDEPQYNNTCPFAADCVIADFSLDHITSHGRSGTAPP